MEKTASQTASRVIRLMNEADVPANSEISVPPYNEVDGYRYANIFVRYTQDDPSQPPVDLAVAFAFDDRGLHSARFSATLEEPGSGLRELAAMQVSGAAASAAAPAGSAVTYVARVPVMGPYMEVFTSNRAVVNRKVTVWAYMVS